MSVMEVGNLCIICAKRKDCVGFSVIDGVATVYVGDGPDRTTLTALWYDNDAIMKIIHELNHGKFQEQKGT